MKNKTFLSNYEVLLLKVISDNNWIHGLSISNELEKRSEGKIKITAGTLYTTLHRLEKKGFVNTKWEDQPHNELGRPRRKLYKITKIGILALKNAIRLIEKVLKPVFIAE